MKISEGFDTTEKKYRQILGDHIETFNDLEMKLVEIIEGFRCYALLSISTLEDKGIEV